MRQALAGTSGSSGKVTVFLYATKFQCMPPPDEEYLLVSAPLRDALPIGSTVITVNKKLKPNGFEVRAHAAAIPDEIGNVSQSSPNACLLQYVI